MPHLESEGIKIFYECKGEGGAPIIFVHGFLCGVDDWKSQVDYFNNERCVVASSLRSHGASDKDPNNCNIETCGDDIIALIDELGLEPAVLVGHSMGCRVILHAYLRAPEKISGLVLIEGSRIGTGDPAAFEEMARTVMAAEGYTNMIRRTFDDMFTADSNPSIKAKIVDRALKMPQEVGESFFPSFLGWDARYMDAALSGVKVPLLVIQSTVIGADSIRVPIKKGEMIPWFELVQQYVPDAQIELITDVGHFCMLEAADKVNQILTGFVSNIG